MPWDPLTAPRVPAQPLDALAALLRGRRVVALTGAGCSTASGIPDYRGPGTLRRARNPIQYRSFIGDAETRRRYWARSAVGWLRIEAARPNAAHRALADWEHIGGLAGVITQNVDRLHHRAGSRRVVELHGALDDVRCLACGRRETRSSLQARLEALNPGWVGGLAEDRTAHSRGAGPEQAPDGDAEVEPAAGFRVAACLACSGALKPDVVFFGESVPKPVVDDAWRLFDRAEALLVAGSSLAVYSGFRFVREASRRGLPVGVINLGPTRGDPLVDVKVEARLGQALPGLLEMLAQG